MSLYVPDPADEQRAVLDHVLEGDTDGSGNVVLESDYITRTTYRNQTRGACWHCGIMLDAEEGIMAFPTVANPAPVFVHEGYPCPRR